jgi:hypothetical protein
MTTTEHLEHLLKMLAPPFKTNFKAWAWGRALELAENPEHAELPALLKAAMTARASSVTTPSEPSKLRQETQPETTACR